ncbi:MAG: alpha-amylase [Candidatus Bipolaricaulota bacterium]|nr:MAG: alpha-amylase [Candidatus Bipolaricaulota bacterium]
MTALADAMRPRPLPRVLLAAFLSVLVLAALAAHGSARSWWEDAVFYEIFVRSFYDSDGDGIGDLDGLIEKLDYLNDGDPTTGDDLGVNALWLMPICESPSYHGYDVVDYYSVEPDYGDLSTFRRLLDEAHARGIRVIVDLVLNHSSSKHPWFLSAKRRASAYRDWYLWESRDPGFLGPWGQTVWHWTLNGYYYGLFWGGMPDLNYRNPEVTAEMHDVIRFWLDDVGVDGFRLDAVKHLIEDGAQQENTPETHRWLQEMRGVVHAANAEALLVGEVWDEPEAIAPYLDDGLDLCFEFSLAEAMLSSVASGSPDRLVSAMARVGTVYEGRSVATFLANHDQDRVMSRLGEDVEAAKLCAALLLTLPGTPFLYYGEEIGMVGAGPHERIRTPMQWSSGAHAGFSPTAPWEPLAEGHATVNVEAQSDHEASLLSRYRELIGHRLATAALRSPEIALLDTGARSDQIVSYVRWTGDQTVIVVANLSWEEARPIFVSLPGGLLSTGPTVAIDLLDARGARIELMRSGERLRLPATDARTVRILLIDGDEA